MPSLTPKLLIRGHFEDDFGVYFAPNFKGERFLQIRACEIPIFADQSRVRAISHHWLSGLTSVCLDVTVLPPLTQTQPSLLQVDTGTS